MVRKRTFLSILVALILVLVLTASCQVVTGNITGTVTNSLTGKPIADVTIVASPQTKNVSITTNVNGVYSASLPIGVYSLTFNKNNFKPTTQSVSVVAGQKLTIDAVLTPTSPVVISAGKDQASSPGSAVTLQATSEPLDGSTVTGY